MQSALAGKVGDGGLGETWLIRLSWSIPSRLEVSFRHQLADQHEVAPDV